MTKPQSSLLLATVLLISSSLSLAADLPSIPAGPENSITPAELRKHDAFLASPELGGRYTLSPSFQIAARYMQTRLESYCFHGAMRDGSFFQKFDLDVAKVDAGASKVTITMNGASKQISYGDFYTTNPADGSASGALVFVGYGLSSKRLNHDDYANLDVKGKIVLIAPGQPEGIDSSKIRDEESGAEAAQAHGAAGALLIARKYYADAMKNPKFRERLIERETVKLAAAQKVTIPQATIGPEAAEQLLGSIGLTLDQIYAAKEMPLGPKPLAAEAQLTMVAHKTVQPSQNVIAVLDGTDAKLKDQYVAFSAHYDHLKTSAKGEVYPGADDDGSGISAVLAIAHAMSLQRPKRSIYVIFHAGEELGLLGSEYNSDYGHVIPLEKMAVDLNIDMIGRSKSPGDTLPLDEHLTAADTIYLVGGNRISTELNQLSEKTNADTEKLKIDYYYNDPNNAERIYFRSDHWNYAKHGVPIIFYFDGTSVDYHQPTDTVDKIDFDKMSRVTKLVYGTGWRIANLDHPLKKDVPQD